LIASMNPPRWMHVYADNAFTSLRTMRELFRRGIFYTGTTVRRPKNYGLPSAIVNAPIRRRGSSVGLTDIFATNSQASCWAWMDKGQGPTMAMSSFYEHTSAATVTRRVGDQVQEIPAPRALRA